MRTQHEELICDTADLHALSLEAMTPEGMAQMTSLLDRLEENLILARGAVVPMMAPALT